MSGMSESATVSSEILSRVALLIISSREAQSFCSPRFMGIKGAGIGVTGCLKVPIEITVCSG